MAASDAYAFCSDLLELATSDDAGRQVRCAPCMKQCVSPFADRTTDSAFIHVLQSVME